MGAPVDYILDDGSGGSNLGPFAFDAHMTWGNVFDAQPGGETITSVSVSFSTSFGNSQSPIFVAVFDDPDDNLDPRDANLVSLSEAVSAPTLPDEFATYGIDPVTVSGTFFVAIIADLEMGQSAARIDQDTPATRSWVFFDGPLNTDLSTQGLAIPPGQLPFPGTFMVRAHGIPAPGSVLAIGTSGLLLARRRR